MNRFLIAALLITTSLLCGAVTAVPWTVAMQQPDGTTLQVQVMGDEFFHYYTTVDGYSLVQQADGSYTYCAGVQGAPIDSRRLAHDPGKRTQDERAWLASTPLRLIDDVQRAAGRQTRQRVDEGILRTNRFDYSRFRGLIILVNYNNRQFAQADPAAFYDTMVNQRGYTGYGDVGDSIQNRYNKFTGSVRDYFYDNSNHLFDPHFDIVGPVNIDCPIDFPMGTSKAGVMFVEALQLADEQVDFSQYDTDADGLVDMVYFIVPGPSASSGAPSAYLWPHKDNFDYLNLELDGVMLSDYACSTEMIKIGSDEVYDGVGTICHEFTHVLGLVDLYDRDYAQGGGQSHHPGSWELMASGNHLNYGRTPAGYSLYDKYSLGFAAPQVINQPGDYTLQPLVSDHEGYLLPSPVEHEFFLFENRQPISWDEALPGHGMIVARVDSTNESMWITRQVNTDPAHNCYQLLRAGNTTQNDLPSDPFPGTNGVTQLTNFTTPNLLTWQNQYNAWGINDIQEQEGVITFKVVDGAAPYTLIEDFEDITPSSDKDLKGVAGKFCKWDFTKCRVEALDDTTLCNGVQALGLFKGAEAQTDTIDYAVSRVTFTVTNANSTVAVVALKYRLQSDETWHTATELNTQATAINVPKGTTQFVYELRLNEPVCLRITNTSGSTTKACYLDDLALYCTARLGGIPGDVNCDGVVDVGDVNEIVNIILGKTADANSQADINNDGTVDVGDVNSIVNIILGKL